MFEKDARFSTGYKGNLGKEILLIALIIIGVIIYYGIIYFFLFSPISLIIYFYFRGFYEYPITKKEIADYKANRKSARKAIIPALIIYTIALLLLTFLDDNISGNYSNSIKMQDGKFSDGEPRYKYKYERVISIWNKKDVVKQLEYEIDILEHHYANGLYADETPFVDNRNIIDRYLWDFYPNFIGFEDYYEQDLNNDAKIREALKKRKPMLEFLLKKYNHNEIENKKIFIYQKPITNDDGEMYARTLRNNSFEDCLFYMGNAKKINDNKYDVHFQRILLNQSYINDFIDTIRVSLKMEKLKKYISLYDKGFNSFWSTKLFEMDHKNNDRYNSLKSMLIEKAADAKAVEIINNQLAYYDLLKENYKSNELAKFITKEFFNNGSSYIFKFMNIIISLVLALLGGAYLEKKNLGTIKIRNRNNKSKKIGKLVDDKSGISVIKKGLMIKDGMKIELKKEGNIIKGYSKDGENYTSVITKVRRLKAWDNNKALQAELKNINGKTIRWKKDYKVNWLLIEKE